MTAFEIVSLAIAGIATGSAATAAAGIWHGIRAMVRAGERRAREQDQRHDETMAALRTQADALAELIRRTGGAQ